MPPVLSRELVEQILGDEGLDERTLARCCRISRDYLDFVRLRLYSHIRIQYTFAGRPFASDMVIRYDPTTLRLLLNLSEHIHLGVLVKSARFDHDGDDGCAVFTTRRQIVGTVLEACPKLESLGCPPCGAPDLCAMLEEMRTNLDSERGFKLLDLGAPNDEMWDVLSLYKFDLRHLLFADSEKFWCSMRGSKPSASDSLEYLELQSLVFLPPSQDDWLDAATFRSLTEYSLDTLTLLRLRFDPRVISDFSIFPNLITLELDIDKRSPITKLAASVRTATTVTTLSFISSFFFDSQKFCRSSPDSVACSLPPAIVRLVLPADLRPDHLVAFVQQLPFHSSLRQISYIPYRPNRFKLPTASSDLEDEVTPEPDYSTVFEACQARSIRLEEEDRFWAADLEDYMRL